MSILKLTKQQYKLFETGLRIEKEDDIYMSFPFWIRPIKDAENKKNEVTCEVLTRGQIPNVTKDYKETGLQTNKYIIKKADGSSIDPDAWYFVLRIDSDPHARAAAMEYCRSIRKENPKLSLELMEAVMGYQLEMKKSSDIWASYYPYKILDPDGWDRKNFDFSYFQEEITWDGFMNRVNQSTIIFEKDE